MPICVGLSRPTKEDTMKIPFKIVTYLIKKSPSNIEWSHPFVQDNIEFVYHIAKAIIIP